MIFDSSTVGKMALIMRVHESESRGITPSDSDKAKVIFAIKQLEIAGIKTIEKEGATFKAIEFEINQLTQDIRDIVTCAETYLTLTRCKECERYNNQGYICIHCGNAE